MPFSIFALPLKHRESTTGPRMYMCALLMADKDWLTTLFIMNNAKERNMSLCFPVSLQARSSKWKLLFNRAAIMSRSLTTHLSRLEGYCMSVSVCLSVSVCVYQVSSKDWAELQRKVTDHSHTFEHILQSTADRAVRMLHNSDSHPLSSSLPVTYESMAWLIRSPTRQLINSVLNQQISHPNVCL